MAALPLMLAVCALVLAPRRERMVVAATGLVALAVATGIPPFFDVVKALPGFDAARNGRLAVISVLCVAVLAGWGLDDLTGPQARRAPPARGARGVRAAARACRSSGWRARIDIDALGDALRVAWGFAHPESDAAAAIRLASLLEWLVLGAAALALLAAAAARPTGASAFVALALALVVLDLFKAGMGYNPAIPESHAVQPTTPAIRYLQEQRPARFAGLHPEAPISLAVPIPPNVAMRYGLYDARGYDFPFEERYAELWRRVIAASPDCNYAFCPESAGRSPRALQALGLLGVTDLLQNHRDPPLAGFEVGLRGPRRARLPQPAPPCRAPSWSTARSWRRAPTAARERGDRRRLPGARGGGHREAASTGSPRAGAGAAGDARISTTRTSASPSTPTPSGARCWC